MLSEASSPPGVTVGPDDIVLRHAPRNGLNHAGNRMRRDHGRMILKVDTAENMGQ